MILQCHDLCLRQWHVCAVRSMLVGKFVQHRSHKVLSDDLDDGE